ncbi:MBL fold metallo-hydrolase [Streptococcus panodentis]|uniref:MBL fold metallo-hydrolase n=1 Tax=Streptococcus panodentis TaxID=1581472 RepID=A0ABS5AV08_9STRE|nr:MULTISPECIES: MBL fold metallo-hydrolase [Streptococcus]KXT84270.1 Hydroxyacylglutathione hydrolase [Streptococcus sp. DD11]MBP2620407.1 MBL fold metallo-hydrolase [Streptococcus panodentis]
MKIHRIINIVAFENTYILENQDHVLVIDPGSEWKKIQRTLEEIGKPLTAVLLTHTHYDHIMSLDKVRDSFAQPPVYVAQSEASWLYSPADNLSGLDRHADLDDIICRPAEEYFSYHQDYHLDGFRFYAVPTPGHSIGGVSFVFPEERIVLSGDALFCGSIGRTDLPTGNLDQLLNSIRQELFILPKDYRVYPGHGNETTIAHEKNFNPFFQTQ